MLLTWHSCRRVMNRQPRNDLISLVHSSEAAAPSKSNETLEDIPLKSEM